MATDRGAKAGSKSFLGFDAQSKCPPCQGGEIERRKNHVIIQLYNELKSKQSFLSLGFANQRATQRYVRQKKELVEAG